jgi:hypothetical protein
METNAMEAVGFLLVKLTLAMPVAPTLTTTYVNPRYVLAVQPHICPRMACSLVVMGEKTYIVTGTVDEVATSLMSSKAP